MNLDDALISIGLKTLADFILAVNMLPRDPAMGGSPIVCPTCRVRCFDLNHEIHEAHCVVAFMLRRANKGKMPEVNP